jgi:outer membrane protein assembly factor BamB
MEFSMRYTNWIVRTEVGGLVLLLALITQSAVGQEWTRFRGPNGAGQSDVTTIPTQWTVKDYNWQIGLPGIGHGSPVVWGDLAFVSSADPETGMRMLFAVRTNDGEVVWKKEYAGTVHEIHVQNSFSSSTPACDADHVYFAWGTPEDFALLALDHRGNEVWRRNLGKFISKHGFGTSPIVYEDMVIITNDQEGESSLVAVDRNSGKTRWQLPRKTLPQQSASYSTPMIFTPPGGKDQLIVNSWAHGITSHDPHTGQLNWEAPVFPQRPVCSPVLAAGLIFGTCGNGAGRNSVFALEPTAEPGGKPQVKYSFAASSNNPYVPTLVAADDLVFLWGDRGVVACLDATTGKPLYEKERVGGTYFSSPIRIGNRIFNISTEGQVVVLAASPEFKVLARNELGEGTRATPAVANGKLLIRTQTKLVSIGGKKD